MSEAIAARRASELRSHEQGTAAAAATAGRTDPVSAKRKTASADLLGVLINEDGVSDDDILSILFDLVIAGSDTVRRTRFFSLDATENANARAPAKKK